MRRVHVQQQTGRQHRQRELNRVLQHQQRETRLLGEYTRTHTQDLFTNSQSICIGIQPNRIAWKCTKSIPGLLFNLLKKKLMWIFRLIKFIVNMSQSSSRWQMWIDHCGDLCNGLFTLVVSGTRSGTGTSIQKPFTLDVSGARTGHLKAIEIY